MRWEWKEDLEQMMQQFGQKGNDESDVTYVGILKMTQIYVKNWNERNTVHSRRVE